MPVVVELVATSGCKSSFSSVRSGVSRSLLYLFRYLTLIAHEVAIPKAINRMKSYRLCSVHCP